MAKTNLIFEVEGKPSLPKLLLFAFQQVLAVLAATILVPTIIGLPVQIPAAILGAGLGTIVYLLFTKFKSPVVISSSFAFLGALANAIAFGYMGIILGGLFAGLVYVVIALIIKFAGTAWVEKLMPPVIIGPTVALIGLSLAGNATADVVTATAASVNHAYNLVALFCGLVTFFTVVICSVQNKFKSGRLVPFILGILAGYVVASIFTAIGMAAKVDYLKIIDWSPLVNNFKNLSVESFITYPRFSLIGGIKELINGGVDRNIMLAYISNNNLDLGLNDDAIKALSDAQLLEAIKSVNKGNGPQRITWIGVAEVALAFIPVAFVTFAEHIADHKNLSSVINRDLLNEPGLSRTLLGDGVGSMVGTVFGICPNTTYGESVGCVAITKNASVRTIFVAACMLIVLAFLSPVTAALRTIPNCVMGGVCLTLYGFIAVSGFKMFQKVDLNQSKNLFIVAAILISGIGGLSLQIPYAVDADGAVAKTIQITSIATALILGIVTMVVCNAIEKLNAPEEAEEVSEEEKVEE